MTTTTIATHTVGIEPITNDTRPHVPTTATRAVVERYDGRLVKVVATDADQLHGTLHEYAQAAAHAYGANLAGTRHDGSSDEVLRRMARLVHGPYNASLPEALHLATRNPATARQAVQRLADTLGRHPRDLPLWGVTRPRAQVAAALRIAAGATR
ncbi:hypothetical protein ABZW11_16955 [Nonomuraea sp. NPDC004580]|uniref:hypothetical protein n=1 Tax=Nonomuraea sp. NPDC004580 TaxID=3154552 RepID=UPI0033AC0759